MSELPSNWKTVGLLDISMLVRGVTYTKSDASEVAFDGSTPVLRANNIQDRKFILSDLVYVPNSLVSEAQQIGIGDVVVATSSGSINVVGKAAQARVDMRAGFGAFCALLRPCSEVNAKYFGHYFSTDTYRMSVSAMARGVNINNLKKDHFEKLVFPLAPLNEQKRIADKLDSILARVDACREHLDRIPAILKRFRQAVLAAATSGKLTEEWRGGDSSNWVNERAANVCTKVQSGGTPKEGFTFNGIPFLKVYNIVDQKISFENKPQYITSEIHQGSMSKSQVQPGDVLMNIVGPPLGKVALVPDTHLTWNINQAITLFRPSNRISTGWIYCILCGGKNIAEIIHETRGSAGQTNISLSQCRDFIFPIPPIEEQTEIVRRVEELFAYADRIEARYHATRARVDKLTPAILAKAFRGELMPQDPNDEPASVLLERIRASRAEHALTSKPKLNRKPAVK
jgi:type I restriction enzyme S subunit